MAKLGAKELAEDIVWHVEITGFEGWKIRLWIVTQLIRLAAWITWANIEFTNSDDFNSD